MQTAQFVSCLKACAPQTAQFTTNDLRFLAMKYEEPGGQMAVNAFMDDLRRVMMRKSIARGNYTLTPGQGPLGGATNVLPGHINPLLGMPVRNTKTETLRRVDEYDRNMYRSQVQERQFEDLVKGTYIRGQTVHEYFLAYASNRLNLYGSGFTGPSEVLERSDFERAVMALDIGWTVQSTGAVFAALESAAGRGSLPIAALDEACCLGCKSKLCSY